MNGLETAEGRRRPISASCTNAVSRPWAIWQALPVTLEKVHADNAEARPQDPCSVSVVYSDCKQALRWIKKGVLKGGKVVQRIIAQSIESQRLGVDVQLHWLQGHRGIPGNELADLVAKRARLRI